jgi:hypothetical protein
MSFFHSIFSEGNHEWKFGSELFHIALDCLADDGYVRHSLILEILVGIDNISEAFLNKFLCGVSVDSLELVIHPYFNISIPSVDNGPQGVIRCEILDDLLKS